VRGALRSAQKWDQRNNRTGGMFEQDVREIGSQIPPSGPAKVPRSGQ